MVISLENDFLIVSFFRIHGNNKEEKFYIWTGHGSNGKSKCIELLEKVLGDYACTFNISLLTQFVTRCFWLRNAGMDVS